ncbi:LysM peptidoglycan-binding domain-containing protein [Paenibacillus sp. Marseille-Q4541]|uniref:LysM peptidoglycan-binding domain-containing protein n=1 Tax=Paenibacillus sp. Marseille-Q4541 TaxID=2831522 RepID=UPI001BAA14C3|nr:LysM peptidoglycan-binding domain-containing protein [Paenibacillus sp. Marseille-Q4541]
MLKYSTYNSIYNNKEEGKDNTLLGKALHSFYSSNKRFIVRMLIILSVVFLSLTGFMNVITNASKVVSYEKFVVSYGDSLWSIATNHKPSQMDTREYVEQIKKLNIMATSDIQTGQVINLPNIE